MEDIKVVAKTAVTNCLCLDCNNEDNCKYCVTFDDCFYSAKEAIIIFLHNYVK